MRKIYLVPNLVTTANMGSGFYSMVLAINQDYVTAAWMILLAGVFDMLDGRIARMAKATSEFGVQYDSMSDLTSFGLAPGMLAYLWVLQPLGRVGWVIGFLYAACGALRLARFNVNTKVIPKSYFQGLPSPASAFMIATFVIFFNAVGWPSDPTLKQYLVATLTLGCGLLMVSTVRFPSFKELNWRSSAGFGSLMVGVGAIILIMISPQVVLFMLGAAYIAAVFAWNILRLVRGEESQGEGNLAELKSIQSHRK